MNNIKKHMLIATGIWCLFTIISIFTIAQAEDSVGISVSTGAVTNELFKAEKIPTYTYKSARDRDPFIPLVGRGESVGAVSAAGEAGKAAKEVNVDLLVLKGYVFSQERKYALFKSADGAAFVLDKGTLVDERGRRVLGIAGIVKQDKVVLITKKNKIKEFKLREESE